MFPGKPLWFGAWVCGEEDRMPTIPSQPGLPSKPPFSTWASFWGLWGLLRGLQTVAKVQVNSEGHVQGVILQDGQEVRSRVVLSCASPQITFLELTPQVRWLRVEVKCLPYKEYLEHGVGSPDYIRVGDPRTKPSSPRKATAYR